MDKTKFTFAFKRKGDHKVDTKLSTQDKFHLRFMAVCTIIADKNKNAIDLIMKSECNERFVIDQDNDEVRYEIVIVDRKERKIDA